MYPCIMHVLYRVNGKKRSFFLTQRGEEWAKQEHDVVLTLLQRPCNVLKSYGRCNNVKTTSCSCWETGNTDDLNKKSLPSFSFLENANTSNNYDYENNTTNWTSDDYCCSWDVWTFIGFTFVDDVVEVVTFCWRCCWSCSWRCCWSCSNGWSCLKIQIYWNVKKKKLLNYLLVF